MGREKFPAATVDCATQKFFKLGARRLQATWFLKIDSMRIVGMHVRGVCVSVCVCLCVPEAINN